MFVSGENGGRPEVKHLYLYLYLYLYLLRYPFVFVGGDNGGRPDKVVEQLFNKLQTRDQGPSAKVL